MINWIIGGLIIGGTIYIIVNTIVRLSKGKTACSCSGCNDETCCSKKEC